MKTFAAFLTLFLFLNGAVFAERSHICAQDALKRAVPLLVLHFGEHDDRISIDDKVKTLRPLNNPENRTQLFDVLEVWGYVYRGKYRMHFIYARDVEGCVLMGQEILEFATL